MQEAFQKIIKKNNPNVVYQDFDETKFYKLNFSSKRFQDKFLNISQHDFTKIQQSQNLRDIFLVMQGFIINNKTNIVKKIIKDKQFVELLQKRDEPITKNKDVLKINTINNAKVFYIIKLLVKKHKKYEKTYKKNQDKNLPIIKNYKVQFNSILQNIDYIIKAFTVFDIEIINKHYKTAVENKKLKFVENEKKYNIEQYLKIITLQLVDDVYQDKNKTTQKKIRLYKFQAVQQMQILQNQNQNFLSIAVIMQHNINTRINNERDQFPLLMCLQNKNQEGILQFLLKNKVSISAQTKTGNTIFLQSCSNGIIKIVSLLLLQYNADINQKDFYGKSGLILASMNGHYDVVEFLCNSKNLIIDEVDLNGNSALLYACKNGLKKILELLIVKGSNINQTNYFGESSISIACQNNRMDIVKLLLDKNVSIKKVDCKDMKCFDYLNQSQRELIKDYVMQNKLNTKLLNVL